MKLIVNNSLIDKIREIKDIFNREIIEFCLYENNQLYNINLINTIGNQLSYKLRNR